MKLIIFASIAALALGCAPATDDEPHGGSTAAFSFPWSDDDSPKTEEEKLSSKTPERKAMLRALEMDFYRMIGNPDAPSVDFNFDDLSQFRDDSLGPNNIKMRIKMQPLRKGSSKAYDMSVASEGVQRLIRNGTIRFDSRGQLTIEGHWKRINGEWRAAGVYINRITFFDTEGGFIEQ